jgi:hypothetical protein
MNYITGQDRHQMAISCFSDSIAADRVVRIIDAFAPLSLLTVGYLDDDPTLFRRAGTATAVKVERCRYLSNCCVSMGRGTYCRKARKRSSKRCYTAQSTPKIKEAGEKPAESPLSQEDEKFIRQQPLKAGRS